MEEEEFEITYELLDALSARANAKNPTDEEKRKLNEDFSRAMKNAHRTVYVGRPSRQPNPFAADMRKLGPPMSW